MGKSRLEKLLEQREAVNARIRREQTKTQTQQRKDDTRRKILAGAAVLDRAEKDAASKGELHRLLAGFLVRDDDRALFGLAPLPGGAGANSVAPATEPDNRAAA
jgi:hypothetical protein